MKVFCLFSVVFTLFTCVARPQEFGSPPGYDLNHPQISNMPPSLIEISGIDFHDGNSSTVYAEQDEEGAVYMLKQDGKITYTGKSVFRDRGDFEDIAICNDWVLMLRSDGLIYTMPYAEIGKKKIDDSREWKSMLPEGEYESMYADNTTNRIYVLCKNCKVDKDDGYKKISGYVFHLSDKGKLKPEGNFKISAREIARRIQQKDIIFKPSAFALNQHTGEWYILSSINKMIVVTDTQWKVKELYRLDPLLYVQPEGIAFDSDNNLYISSEGSAMKPGTIFKFLYKPRQ